MKVSNATSPVWIAHAEDDTVASVLNSIRFYEALVKKNAPAEMHLYPKGGHGITSFLPIEKWMQPLFEWIKKNKWMD